MAARRSMAGPLARSCWSIMQNNPNYFIEQGHAPLAPLHWRSVSSGVGVRFPAFYSMWRTERGLFRDSFFTRTRSLPVQSSKPVSN